MVLHPVKTMIVIAPKGQLMPAQGNVLVFMAHIFQSL